MAFLSMLLVPLDRRARRKARIRARRAARRVVPRPARLALNTAHAGWVARGARRAFESAGKHPEWLDLPALDALHREYPLPERPYRYDPDRFEREGRQRAAAMLSALPLAIDGAKTLELGCGDAMLSSAVAEKGAVATAVDLTTRLFDERARRRGVRLVQADAAELPLESGQFDLVFSFNAFEHFSQPDAAFREALRVVRPGGLIHLHFGPLYLSPFGLHVFHMLGVPYCHLLFPPAVLQEYVEAKGLGKIHFDSVNGWSVEGFRQLFGQHASDVDRLLYREEPTVSGAELIARYPSCFRSKTDCFDNLVVGNIEALFRRTG
jgi:SAM-dependent methyltransferase